MDHHPLLTGPMCPQLQGRRLYQAPAWEYQPPAGEAALSGSSMGVSTTKVGRVNPGTGGSGAEAGGLKPSGGRGGGGGGGGGGARVSAEPACEEGLGGWWLPPRVTGGRGWFISVSGGI